MKNRPFSIIERIKSFKHAFHGLKLFFVSEHNGRVHLLAALLAVSLSIYLKLSVEEWIAILTAIAVVLIAEMLNTAIEKLADVVSPELHPVIKIVKDVAAAAVMVAALLALAIAGLIFLPKFF